MQTRKAVYLTLSAIAPVLAAGLVYELYALNYMSAWILGTAAILCMEGRAQVYKRVLHNTLFWIHIAAAVPFFIGLTILAFWAQTALLVLITSIACAITLVAGGIMLVSGVREALSATYSLQS